jgi:hypothetical protein
MTFLGPLFFIFMEHILQDWAPVINQTACYHMMTLKEQLSLEAEYHPSWAMRQILKLWQQEATEGRRPFFIDALSYWGHPNQPMILEDFYTLLADMALQHPTPFPLGRVLRWLCVICLSLYLGLHHMSAIESLLLSLPLVLLITELWVWGAWKQRCLVLRWWQNTPAPWTKIGSSGIPEPVFITQHSERQLWLKMWSTSPDLLIAASKFAGYWRLVQQRRHQRLRQYCAVLLDLSTLWLFMQMSNNLMYQFYHG